MFEPAARCKLAQHWQQHLRWPAQPSTNFPKCMHTSAGRRRISNNFIVRSRPQDPSPNVQPALPMPSIFLREAENHFEVAMCVPRSRSTARHSINHMIQTRLPSSGMGPPDLQCCGARGEEENQGMAAQQRAHENLCAPWPDDTCTCGKCAQLCNEEAGFDVGLCVQITGKIGTIHSALACRVGPVVTT